MKKKKMINITFVLIAIGVIGFCNWKAGGSLGNDAEWIMLGIFLKDI